MISAKLNVRYIHKFFVLLFLFLTHDLAERLYWIEGVYDYIETSDLNGGDRKAIAVDTFSHMRSIFVHGDYVYYTGFKRQ